MMVYIAILRGINVSGHKKINMNDLKDLFMSLNFENVTTYIQSGNVVFTSKASKPEDLAGQIEQEIAEKYGFHVPVIIRTQTELTEGIKKNPFTQVNTDNLYVTFLADLPAQANIDRTNTYQYEPDEFIISGREVFVFCQEGYGRTKLHNNFFESKLKVTATTRNWKTINKLAEMTAVIA